MPASEKIVQLVERFKDHLQEYRSIHYHETPVRRDFIDPMFRELGWDVDNQEGYAEPYRDVVHEDAIKIGGSTKAPDYCFRIGGQRKFFVEAKKPSVNLDHDMSAAFQVRRYAWTAKLPLSILTDFEEFVVYDTRIKPLKTDKASTARIKYIRYDEYIDRWDEIAELFHKQSILKGSFDSYLDTAKKIKGTTTVDDAFLAEIESWRDALARNLAVRNKELTQRELNFAVQRIIDRIVFLRICEDRGVEPYGQLQLIQQKPDLYRNELIPIFHRADQKYNSGLFHFSDERGRPTEPDKLTLGLKIDDKTLKSILNRLYYPDSPYEFSVMPAEILGQVYERFLGSVIRLTAGHQAKIEEKPEVRKAGGVYYTPAYIVEYIVKQTVGKLLEGKKPKDIAELKIADISCGSGSFLIGAYQFLLNWHRDYYLEKGNAKEKKLIYEGHGGEWKLTTDERKRILLANIYGVDIDPQAVETTKLSLLLKVLEGENEQSLAKQMEMFKQRALPDLGHNIKCGNSLIGTDFYHGQQLGLLDEETEYRINAFDWQAEFPTVFKAVDGGFDAIIGNPPYGFHEIHEDFLKPYFKEHLLSSQGSFEHYFLFYEKSLQLLKKGGLHGFIVPVTWLTIPSALSLRQYILNGYNVERIVWLPELVFKNAQVNTLISIIHAGTKPGHDVFVDIYDVLEFKQPPVTARSYKQSTFIDDGYILHIFRSEKDIDLVRKIVLHSMPLSEFARPCSGYNPYENGKGIAPDGGPHTKRTVKEKPYHSEIKLDDTWKPEIIGRNLRRFHVDITLRRWIKYGEWLAAPREKENFQGKRILVQEITGGKDKRIIAGFMVEELYYSRDVIPVKVEDCPVSEFYLLGIINSTLITWYHHKSNPKAQKGLFPKILVSDLRKLPIRPIDFSNKADKARHDRMVELVQAMLDLNKRLDTAKTHDEKKLIERRITATDTEIDRLVYDLYGLSDEEIAIVEGEK